MLIFSHFISALTYKLHVSWLFTDLIDLQLAPDTVYIRKMFAYLS